MVSLNYNQKTGELVKANGLRSQAWSLYNKKSDKPFKISRSKFSNFLDCERCFYLDRVKGLKEPGTPGWALNSTVDDLLKKEFDYYREQKKPHPIFKDYNLNFVPFQHKDIDIWREAKSGGIQFHHQETNLIIQGGVDDIWFNLDTEEIVICDYKAQSSKGLIDRERYLTNVYHLGYKTQMDIYAYILKNMGFSVSKDSYFMVCNGIKERDSFDKNINFEVILIKYEVSTEWIGQKVLEMNKTLDSDIIPVKTESCQNCAYIETASQLLGEKVD